MYVVRTRLPPCTYTSMHDSRMCADDLLLFGRETDRLTLCVEVGYLHTVSGIGGQCIRPHHPRRITECRCHIHVRCRTLNVGMPLCEAFRTFVRLHAIDYMRMNFLTNDDHVCQAPTSLAFVAPWGRAVLIAILLPTPNPSLRAL